MFDKSRKIKVIRILSSLGTGGAETVTRNHLIKIDKDRFNVLLFVNSFERKTINSEYLNKNNINIKYFAKEIVSLPYIPISSFIQRVFRAPQIFGNRVISNVKMFMYICMYRPDVIHMHIDTLTIFSKLQYRFIANVLKIKLYYTCSSIPESVFKKEHELKKAKYLLNKCNLTIIALHNEMAYSLKSMFCTDNVIVLYNGVDVKKFRDCQIDRTSMLNKLGMPAESIIIGHIGRFSHVKNHRFLIDVFENVLKKEQKAQLLLIGSGLLKDDIYGYVKEKKLSEHVKFMGERNDIPEMLKIMDVFVLPSLYEGFSNVLLEAQASGVKCVVSDTITKEETLTDSISYLSLNDTLDIWSDYILNIDVKMDHKLGIDDLDYSQVVRKLENIYENKKESDICSY